MVRILTLGQNRLLQVYLLTPQGPLLALDVQIWKAVLVAEEEEWLRFVNWLALVFDPLIDNLQSLANFSERKPVAKRHLSVRIVDHSFDDRSSIRERAFPNPISYAVFCLKKKKYR